MSMPFFIKEDILTFREYLLSESIIPTECNYGLNFPDLNNKEWKRMNEGVIVSYVHINELWYFILITTNGDVMFGTSNKSTENIKEYSSNRHQTHNILKVFGNLIYVMLEGVDKLNLKIIKFTEANPALGTAYKSMVNNKWLLLSLKERGFEKQEKEDDYFIFRR
jgi:hypothetical protein